MIMIKILKIINNLLLTIALICYVLNLYLVGITIYNNVFLHMGIDPLGFVISLAITFFGGINLFTICAEKISHIETFKYSK